MIRGYHYKSALYLAGQYLLGAVHARRLCIAEYVDALPGQRILDIGCGPAYILDFLPDVDYVGFDTNPEHIGYASVHYAGKGQFRNCSFTEKTAKDIGKFDRILMFGLLHHINDEQALSYMKLARDLLLPGGSFISLDGVICDGQSRITRFLLSRDEGRYVRNEQGYRQLAASVFSGIKPEIRRDMFYVPYEAIILNCF